VLLHLASLIPQVWHQLWKTCTNFYRSIGNHACQLGSSESPDALRKPSSLLLNERGIDKNWGEIDKKCWTEIVGDFTLKSDR